MRRASQAMGFIVIIALFVAVLLLSLMLLKMVKDSWGDVERSDCYLQVRAHSKIVQATDEGNAPTITCPTERLEAEDHPKAQVADAMASCWDTWGRGNLPLFKDEDAVFCHICSTIELDGPLEDLPEYLDDSIYSNGLTYSQFLSGKIEGKVFTGEDMPKGSQPRFSEKVGVIFLYAKEKKVKDDSELSIWDLFSAQGFLAIGTTASLSGQQGVALWAQAGQLVASIAEEFSEGTDDVKGMFFKEISDHLAVVVVREFDEQGLLEAGCQYAPVANE